ncbi:hypothetical protein TVAG_470110 [Trichomonas vaginalis G3]|uniref:Uncharacterized protein n=1 Tax=Trichomonas vaginalis (strain ATCC PRA-98 / G3) TaxID=412133 RepID=A2FE18_TRIV3|nr:DnaJ domain domain-containing protein [Trichomonas vaginalis G3]EAX96846.1 hypothetical protein TVAG_470110 [Trichomonas vaginalis G3]KAI5520689.1 DnaJ domain domain-containing protein [Trichomonas vaginalis G3]|eukprot:XP_001309776.1 hypothetical protein [Trichomonas vaginalis G3]
MVIVELAGLVISSTKVVCSTFINGFKHAAAANAPNGNAFQKFAGAVFGIQFQTRMMPDEARQILGFEQKDKLDIKSIKEHLDRMIKLNDLEKGGSPYLNERFIAASHVLAK